MFKVTYVGHGVVSNKLGAFQRGTIACTTDESVARELALDPSFEVRGQDGVRLVAVTERPLNMLDLCPFCGRESLGFGAEHDSECRRREHEEQRERLEHQERHERRKSKRHEQTAPEEGS